MSKFFKRLCWSPTFCLFFVAMMKIYDGNPSSATTWLVLGAFNAVLNYATKKK